MPYRMDRPRVPGTQEEVAALEATYRTFEPASAYATVRCDTDRWQRHADALRAAVHVADPQRWEDVRARFLRAAALDSTALAEMIRPAPDLTTVVLRSSLSDDAWNSAVEQGRLVVECHRRALVVASDAVAARRPIDENLIARLQDLIVESQATFTVSVDGGAKTEIDLPRRQYKPISNYLLRTDLELVPFAPADEVGREMQRLVAEFGSRDFDRLHPVVQSAYLHLALVHVHPFADGNGRLARTLAAMPVLREAGVPPLLLSDQWPAYVQALLDSDEGHVQPLVDLFLAAQVNAMDLACNLLTSDGPAEPPRASTAPAPQRTLLDLVAVHLREAIGLPPPGTRAGVSRDPVDPDTVRVARVRADGGVDTELRITATREGSGEDWSRLTADTGDVLEGWHRDVDPVPTEIVHLRVRAWLDGLLRNRRYGAPPSARARGLFVLGSPRSGTTVIGNWIGSHPAVLGLAEYGGFYVAHSVAPSYLEKLPGRAQDGFLEAVRAAAAEHVTRLARHGGHTWFCDATPWNLQVAGDLAGSLPDAVFVLMLRHFSGAIVSLRQFAWAGATWQDAARLWVTLHRYVAALPADRTVAVGYDALAAHPAETVAALREVLGALGLDPAGFDDRQFATSHAHVVGRPRPTVASLDDSGRTVFRPMASLDEQRWTPEAHAAVWPVVAETHRELRERFPGVYSAPSRPQHVPDTEW
jgi:hypothetical protein